MVDVFRPTIKGRRSTFYYGKVRDPRTNKWRKVSLKVTDKGVARQKLIKLQQRMERAAHGMLDPLQETPLTDHLSKFMLHLEQQGRSLSYRQQTECEILKVVFFCSGKPVLQRLDRKRLHEYRASVAEITLDSITTDKVDSFLATLPEEKAARTRIGQQDSVPDHQESPPS
jgi:hypothetical protein